MRDYQSHTERMVKYPMKLYSDTLTTADLYRATKGVGCEHVSIDELDLLRRPRLRRNGWEVKLTGSSPYNGHGRRVKAATYDEHGWWMVALFALDPNMIVSGYRGVNDFHEKTRGAFAGV